MKPCLTWTKTSFQRMFILQQNLSCTVDSLSTSYLKKISSKFEIFSTAKFWCRKGDKCDWNLELVPYLNVYFIVWCAGKVNYHIGF